MFGPCVHRASTRPRRRRRSRHTRARDAAAVRDPGGVLAVQGQGREEAPGRGGARDARRRRRDATRRDARAREKVRAIDAAAVGRATRARAAGDDAERARREGRDGRGRGTTRGRTRGRARADGGRESIREGIGELGIGWRGRRDARTRD